MNNGGMLIVFEGSDGAGKSTQIGLLARKLTESGHTCICLREPGGTEIGEQARQILKHSKSAMAPSTELLLMNASRAQLVAEVILPALAAGKVILMDRFFQSTIAYQGFGRQLPLPTVECVIRTAVGDLQPDHVFLLRIPLEVCIERRTARQTRLPLNDMDRFEKEEVEFFKRVEEGYSYVALNDPQHVHVIDATQSVEEVHAAICQHL